MVQSLRTLKVMKHVRHHDVYLMYSFLSLSFQSKHTVSLAKKGWMIYVGGPHSFTSMKGTLSRTHTIIKIKCKKTEANKRHGLGFDNTFTRSANSF